MRGRHIMLSGDVGAGKSTLIKRLLTRIESEKQIKLYGFFTKKVQAAADGSGAVYIHPAKEYMRDFQVNNRIAAVPIAADNDLSQYPVYVPGLSYSMDNQVGVCTAHHATGKTEIFDTLGVRLLDEALLYAGVEDIIIMDEIGVMEKNAEEFKERIKKVLDSDFTVITAIKNKDMTFLNELRSDKRAEQYFITKENREELYQKVLAGM